MGRRIGRIATALAAVLALGGLGALTASPAQAGIGFTCSFDVALAPSVRMDVCLERLAPGAGVRAVVQLENYSSQFVHAQYSAGVAGIGSNNCGLVYVLPGSVRGCQSDLFIDVDWQHDDRAVANITWNFLGGQLHFDSVSSPVG